MVDPLPLPLALITTEGVESEGVPTPEARAVLRQEIPAPNVILHVRDNLDVCLQHPKKGFY